MMKARCGGCFCGVHVMVDVVDDLLQHGSGDACAARAAGDQSQLSILEYKRWSHGRQRTLARLYGIGIVPYQPIRVGHTRLGREIIHFVIEQNACALGHNAAAKVGVERISDGHCVASLVHHGVMRGLVAFIGLRFAGLDVAAGSGFACLNRRSQIGGVAFAGQSGQRDFHKIRVTQIFGAVGISQLHGLGHVVHALCTVRAPLLHGPALHHVEYLNQVRAAR